jgi:hypothetical protein
MADKVTIDGKDYSIENLSEESMATLNSLQFAAKREAELSNIMKILQRAKNSYVDSLKKEILSNKTGLLFGDDN